jgi:hypothetical protein
MKIPTVHLNGTAKSDLMDALSEAYHAILDAEAKLAACAPNGRDYYPQGFNVIYEAQDEHSARFRKLDDVAKEIDALRDAIDRQ